NRLRSVVALPSASFRYAKSIGNGLTSAVFAPTVKVVNDQFPSFSDIGQFNAHHRVLRVSGLQHPRCRRPAGGLRRAAPRGVAHALSARRALAAEGGGGGVSHCRDSDSRAI